MNTKDPKHELSERKSDHLRINLEKNVRSGISNGLEKFHFIHQALPDLDLEQVDTSVVFLKKQLKIPVIISSMTGGSSDSLLINQNLAKAAQNMGVALGLGSIRAAIEDEQLAASFQVRKFAPDAMIFANLGAVQLNYSYTIEHCIRAMDMTRADGLILHLNPLQEALQINGDTNFKNLLQKIETICKLDRWPVIVKEVGWGISAKVARQLSVAGVSAIDVSGAGGTSWSQVEKYRIRDEISRGIAEAFVDWGIPLVDSLMQVKDSVPDIPIIASGGLKTGIDLGKCIALGASLGGFAGAILPVATISAAEVEKFLKVIEGQLRIAMFSSGIKNIETLKNTSLVME